MRPLIGITAHTALARRGDWEERAVLSSYDLVAMVRQAGGRPLLVPADPDGGDELVGALAGLVLSGGPDVDPGLYGEQPHPRTCVGSAADDAAEVGLARTMLGLGVPVLGVCRGFQLLNVALGGDLVQHLPDVVGHVRHAPAPGRFGRHPVTVAEGSRCHVAVGGTAEVYSHHHQAVRRLAEPLVAAAWSDDGVVEAGEAPGEGFVVGVQWHPEAGTDASLFAALIGAAVGNVSVR
ncbi:MAG: gamma-glutamyl-gamma-aminobutyrate hydrolase family protein [Streptosporangiaceae bacterium]